MGKDLPVKVCEYLVSAGSSLFSRGFIFIYELLKERKNGRRKEVICAGGH